MSDEKDLKELHGISIDSNGHDRAFRYLEKHVGKEQLEEMIHTAKTAQDKNAKFTAVVDGKNHHYKIEHHDGKNSIRPDHNH